jgi:hypothetical protein
MKKSFEKFLAITAGTLNLLFLILIGLIIYKKLDVTLLDNQLVVTLLSILGAINIILLGFIIANAFIDRETLAAVMLFSDKTSSTRAGINVVKKIVRRSAKQLGNVKVAKTALFLEENNGLRMRIAVKIREDEVEDAIDKFRCLLIDEFMNILEIEFNSIDFKVTALKTNYKANLVEIGKRAEKIKEERAAKQAREKERKLLEEGTAKAADALESEAEAEDFDGAESVGADIIEEAPEEVSEDIDAAESTGADIPEESMQEDIPAASLKDIDSAESTGEDIPARVEGLKEDSEEE